MKNKEEPSIDSLRGNPSSTEETTGSLSRPGSTAAAQVEQPALSLFPETLMEAVVDSGNMERAWKNVKANRGAGTDRRLVVPRRDHDRGIPRLASPLLAWDPAAASRWDVPAWSSTS